MEKCLLTLRLRWIPVFLLFFACHKSATNTVPPAIHPSLEGKWTIFKYIAANFDTSGGKTPLPNDTIYPTHVETENFTKDSVYTDTWEGFSYFFMAAKDSFYNVQNREYLDTSAYTATAAYILEYRYSPYDTVFIVNLSDTLLVTNEKTYEGAGTSGPVLYHLNSYAGKQ